ncbi:small secreted protein [Xylariaceae sp. FL0662B]|nr:small secreted protein [Xylariaceae sp. FL0662B]
MYFATTLMALLSLAALSTQTNFKADEFSDDHCSHRIYPHVRHLEVTMDDKSKSVYLASTNDDKYQWQAYSGKTHNGGSCTGDMIGNITTGFGANPCHNLDTTFDRRIKCVKACYKWPGGAIVCRAN